MTSVEVFGDYMRTILCLTFLYACGLCANTSEASGPNVWDGTYVGMQLGEATNAGCSQWALPDLGTDGAAQTIGACASGSVVGGVQIGDNFQYKHVFWGLAADVNFATLKKTSQSLVASGTVPPPGTYIASERVSPRGFFIVAPRLGYAGHEWAPYVRAGGLLAIGGQNSSLTYRPVSAGTGVQPTASFTGERSFTTIGWVAGGGMEWGLNGPWSIGVEFMHATLGKGGNASANCGNTSTVCQRFSGIAFENEHSAFTANIYRASINYYFDYW